MQTLYNLRKESFTHICLPHSVDLQPSNVIVEGKQKLEEYIQYREEREHHIKEVVKKRGTVTREELYQDIYGQRNLTDGLRMAAYHNLDLNIEKLIKDGFMSEERE